MPVAVWARLATRDDGVVRFAGQAVEVESYAALNRVSAFKIKALLALGKPKELAASVEVVGPCGYGAKAEDYTSVLEDVTASIGPIVDGFVKGAVDKDVFFLLRPDATAGAWRRGCRRK